MTQPLVADEPKKISLGSWAFSFGPYTDNPVPFDQTARRLAETGYDGIEICGFPPHITVEKYPTRESRQPVVDLLKELRLGVSGYAADLTAFNPVVAANEKDYLALFQKNVQMCVHLGSPTIRVDTIAAPDSIPDSEYHTAFQQVAKTWRQAADLAQQFNIRLVWEFEPGFAFNKPSEVEMLHDAVGHPNFQIMFDTSHAYMSAVVGARQRGEKETLEHGVEEFLQRLEGRIGAIHLIDSDGTLHHDETSTHRPFGEGHLDWQHLAPRLMAVPNIEWWCVDLCFWPGSWELVESSRDFVMDVILANAGNPGTC